MVWWSRREIGETKRLQKDKIDRSEPWKNKELTKSKKRKTNSNKRKKLCLCACKHKCTNNSSDLSPFCLHVHAPLLSLHPFPNRFSYPLALSSLLLFALSHPSPIFMLSLPSLAHLSSTLCLGAIAANQTVYPALISTLPHEAPAPSKQWKQAWALIHGWDLITSISNFFF